MRSLVLPVTIAAVAVPMDVLVVEDDAALRDVMSYHLRTAGFGIRLAADGDQGLAECAARVPDVVVLDVMLPGRSGLEVCAALRERDPLIPGVIMVTARGSEADVVCGFDSGADDYVVKPFRPRELIARVSALGRRIQGGARTEPTAAPACALAWGPLRVDSTARRALVSGQPLKLTPTELSLLELLLGAPGQAFSRAQLLAAVWDTTHEGYARNVDCHVARLRRKLEQAGVTPDIISTVHGTGYSFDPGAC